MYNGIVCGQNDNGLALPVQEEQPKIEVAINYLQGQVGINQSLSRRILVALAGQRPIVACEKNQKAENLSEMICRQAQEIEEANQRLEEVLHILLTNLGENIKLE